MNDQIKNAALQTLELEAQSIAGLKKFIDDDFEKTVKLFLVQRDGLLLQDWKKRHSRSKNCSYAKFYWNPSFFMHAADAIHGDIGMVQKDDVVMIISKSGESPEIKVLVP